MAAASGADKWHGVVLLEVECLEQRNGVEPIEDEDFSSIFMAAGELTLPAKENYQFYKRFVSTPAFKENKHK